MNRLNTILSKIMPSVFKPEVSTASPVHEEIQNASTTPIVPAANNDLVDVEQLLIAQENRSSQKLDWRHSIVDLMKLVGMDSDLRSRQELARDLKYSGDMNDSARMNLWLHQQVMLQLEQNGGKIPDTMKH